MGKMQRRDGMKVVVTLPKGWSLYLVGRKVVAIHPEHKPRFMQLSMIETTPFDQWWELFSFEKDDVEVHYNG